MMLYADNSRRRAGHQSDARVAGLKPEREAAVFVLAALALVNPLRSGLKARDADIRLMQTCMGRMVVGARTRRGVYRNGISHAET
jgi:hypothetical protein